MTFEPYWPCSLSENGVKRRFLALLTFFGVIAGFLGNAAHAQTFFDPLAYCKAVGTFDAPDKRYTGPSVTTHMQEIMEATKQGYVI